MRYIITKTVSFICVICMFLTSFCGITTYAAESETPQISITLNQTKKKAEINLSNVGTMIYSAQITLTLTETDASKYALTAKDSNAYVAVKTGENDNIVLYIDSNQLMDGSREINLASLTSDAAMSFGDTAQLTLVNRSMRPVSYSNVKVNVKKSSTGGGSGGGGGGGSASATSAVQPTETTKPTEPTAAPITETNAPQPSEIPTTVTQFNDVGTDYWAKDSIKYVTEKGLFNGTSDVTFEPETNMTRAMYVTVLNRFGTAIDSKWNISCSSPLKFSDVPDGEWYSNAVAWAGGTGLVNGIGDDMFGPDESVTREQIAVMTVNFAKACGVTLPEITQKQDFTDEVLISDWAKDAVTIAQKAGLINGREEGNFAPQDTATRAEVAAILYRFVKATENAV